MYWWIVLEISEDSDVKTIRKAYSKLLKSNNPEDNPEGYQRLREAYDAAIKYAKKNNKENREVINNDLHENVTSKIEVSKNKEDIYENNINEEKKISFQHELYNNNSYYDIKDTKLNLNIKIMQFLSRLNDIYYDLSLRSDIEVWEELLNSDVIWDVEAFPIIEEEVFEFLTTHKYLPAEIWIKLNDNFTWSQNEIKLYNKYSDIVVDEILKNLKEPNNLKYDYIKTINPEIAEEYLYERDEADKSLKNKEYLNAYGHLKRANSLFEGDSELLKLNGDYEYNFDHLKTALEYYKSALEVNNNDLSSALHIGIILVTYKNFSEAIPYLSLYLSHNSDDKLALKYIAYCYYYNDDLVMAKEKFQKLKSLDENDKITKKYLKNIEALLMGKNIRRITFDRESLIQEKEAKNEINTDKNYNIKDIINGNMNPVVKYIIRVIIMIVIFNLINHTSVFNNSYKNNTQNNKVTYENKENTNKEKKNNVSKKDFEKAILDPNKNNTVSMDLHNVKQIKYYKISEPFKNRSIFSKGEIDQNGLWDKVESQVCIGATNDTVVIFADSKCNDNTIKKDGEYRVGGKMCPMNEKIGYNIMKAYESDYQGIEWISNGFIDASKK